MTTDKQWKAYNNAISTPFPDRPANQIATERTPDQIQRSKQYREAFRNGDRVVTLSETSHGIILSNPEIPLPEGIPKGFRLMQEAHIRFDTGPATKEEPFTGAPTGCMKLGHWKYEEEYRDYFDDLVKNEVEWMTFFDHPMNSHQPE